MAPRMGPDDAAYQGIAAYSRCFYEDGSELPVSQTEVLQALFRTNTVVRNRNGKKLSANEVTQAVADGELEIFFARDDEGSLASDPNPVVVDRSELLAQMALDGPASTIRSVAAGTCARGDGKVDRNGYLLFGWIFYGARTSKKLCVAEISRGPLPTIQARKEAAARACLTARRSSRRSSDLSVPSAVRLVRDSGLRSFWTSSVEGGKHVRSWGLLSQHTAFSTALDFGEGGEDGEGARLHGGGRGEVCRRRELRDEHLPD